MERKESVILTNLCMIYDDKANVVVEEKIGKDYKGLIFPGGHIEEKESFVDSVIREIYEETGLSISNLKFCGIKDWIMEDNSRYIVFLYKTNTFSGELISSSEGRVFWMPLDELKKSKDMLWHTDLMLKIFCEDEYSELYFDANDKSYIPILK